MPDLSPTIDGRGLKIGTTWANTVGDGVSAASIQTSTAQQSSGIFALDVSDFNATQVERYFVEFDTSGVTSVPQSAIFKLYGLTNSAADVICAQASFASAGAIVADDWDSWNEASPVAYTNELETWSTSGYNEFTITAAGLSAMASLDEFQMICMEADNDYDQTSAGSGLVNIKSGYYTRSESDASKRPVLSYVAGAGVSDVTIKAGTVTLKAGNFTIR